MGSRGRKTQVQGYTYLHSKFEASLAYIAILVGKRSVDCHKQEPSLMTLAHLLTARVLRSLLRCPAYEETGSETISKSIGAMKSEFTV